MPVLILGERRSEEPVKGLVKVESTEMVMISNIVKNNITIIVVAG